MHHYCHRSAELTKTLVSLIFILLICSDATTTSGQIDGRLAEKPIGTGYVRDITQLRMAAYVKGLAERLDVGSAVTKMYSELEKNEDFKSLQPKVEHPVTGTAWYLVQGLIPSFETVYFSRQPILPMRRRK
ncbi:MAG: hypothetical protein R3C59_28210 [Planctomycetaceae bacterium]